MNKKKIMKILLFIFLVIILLACIFAYLLNQFLVKRMVSIDNTRLRYLEESIHETVYIMEYYGNWDEASIEEYNKLFDGNEHYLHDIDLNTKFGEELLIQLQERVGSIRNFDDYEVPLREHSNKDDKDIVIKYSDEKLVFRIPHSNMEYRFWKGKKEVEYTSKITYFEPHIWE